MDLDNTEKGEIDCAAKYLGWELYKMLMTLEDFVIEDDDGWLYADYGGGVKRYSLRDGNNQVDGPTYLDRIFDGAWILQDLLSDQECPASYHSIGEIMFVLMAARAIDWIAQQECNREQSAKGGKASTKWTTEVDRIARTIFTQVKRSKVSNDAAFRRTAAKLATDYGTSLSKDTVKRNLLKPPAQQ